MVAHALRVQGQLGLHDKFQAARIHNEILSQRNQNYTYQLPTEIVNVKNEN